MGVSHLLDRAPRGGHPHAADAHAAPARTGSRPGLIAPTQVTIWAADLAPGRLPTICCVTGEPATHWMRFSFLTVPTWMRVLIVPALFFRLLLVYRLLARVAGTAAGGSLPVTRAWWWTFMTIRWGSRGLFSLAIAMAAWALVVTNGPAPETLLGWAVVALFVSALLGWVAWPAVRPHARVRRVGPGYWVELSGVHPRFAEAVRERYSA